MLYNVDFDICAVFVSIFTIFFIFFNKGIKKTENKIFLCLIISAFIASVFDTLTTYVNAYIFKNGYTYMDFTNYVFLIFHNISSYSFLLYIIYLMHINYKIKKLTFYILTLPIITSVLAILTNPFTHLVYYFNKNNIYTHGPLIHLLYINAIIYLFISLGIIIKYRHALSKIKLITLITFVILCTIPIGIQFFYPTLLIELFFQSIGLLGILFSIENKDDIIDNVTHVYNRYSFISAIDSAISTRTSLTIIVIKLPSFNYHNSTVGIKNMNGFLTEIAAWLNSLVSSVDCYDCEHIHFALLNYKNDDTEIKKITDTILDKFNHSWSYNDLRIIFPVQLCIIKIPENVNTLEQLMFITDTPFKPNGTESELVDLNTFNEYKRKAEVEKCVEKALANKSFQVWYQPIWDCVQEKVYCAEALLRLFDDELGFISPDEFIPIAEKNGAIVDVGKFVFEEVCKLYTENNLQKFGIKFIEVNLSVLQCMNKKLTESFEDLLKKYNLKASCINLEITESAAASNQQTLINSVSDLNKHGFRFALDDYGSGYSNFSYMFGMPFSIIKLDKSILWSAIDPKTGEKDKNALLYLESTMNMLKKMNYKIVVEGVETEEQKDILNEYHCDYIQGYYYSKPIPKDEFIKLINEYCKDKKQT